MIGGAGRLAGWPGTKKQGRVFPHLGPVVTTLGRLNVGPWPVERRAMKEYIGKELEGFTEVYVYDPERNRYLPLEVHTPEGQAEPISPTHAWGHGRDETAQLALDVLWDYLGEEPAPGLRQAFTERHVLGQKRTTFYAPATLIETFILEYDTAMRAEIGGSQ